MGTQMMGRTVLVTGAASGIGKACAALFHAEGARLILLDRDAERVQAVASGLAGSEAIVVDVTDPDTAGDRVQQAIARAGGLNGLVNAAGISRWVSFDDMSFAQWREVMAVNLDGPMIVTKAAWPALKEAGGATIVNLASGAGLQPRERFSAYCASKAGLILLTRTLAMEGAAHKLRVNAVCPGIVMTPMVERNLALSGDPQAAYQRYVARNRMGRFGEADEIAQAVLFLSTDASSFMTGSAVSIDGGSVFH
jgi:NAD(P)-dependent dehydrogenase (short-subunit alcohol dehydrogenase family)